VRGKTKIKGSKERWPKVCIVRREEKKTTPTTAHTTGGEEGGRAGEGEGDCLIVLIPCQKKEKKRERRALRPPDEEGKRKRNREIRKETAIVDRGLKKGERGANHLNLKKRKKKRRVGKETGCLPGAAKRKERGKTKKKGTLRGGSRGSEPFRLPNSEKGKKKIGRRFDVEKKEKETHRKRGTERGLTMRKERETSSFRSYEQEGKKRG